MSPRKPELRAQFIRAYLELNMLVDAAEELEQIRPEERGSREVLDAWLEFALRARSWEQAVEVGARLARADPDFEPGWIGWAYALRELQRIEEARQVLLRAEVLHRKSAVLHFNLACYHALLGDPATARKYLGTACKLRPEFKAEALTDPDLQSLW